MIAKPKNFLFVWINSDEFELINSIGLIRKHYPESSIYLVGDKPKHVYLDKHITFKQKGNVRASRVTSAILHACNFMDEFVLMYDDVFLNEGYDFDNAFYRGELRKDRPSGNYQLCLHNTRKFLEYHNKPTLNYECHQPELINSKMFIELMDQVNWQDNYHLIKSLYFNFYDLPNKQVRNLKTHTPNEAKKLYEDHKCFSSVGGITPQMKNYITSLKNH